MVNKYLLRNYSYNLFWNTLLDMRSNALSLRNGKWLIGRNQREFNLDVWQFTIYFRCPIREFDPGVLTEQIWAGIIFHQVLIQFFRIFYKNLNILYIYLISLYKIMYNAIESKQEKFPAIP